MGWQKVQPPEKPKDAYQSEEKKNKTNKQTQ